MWSLAVRTLHRGPNRSFSHLIRGDFKFDVSDGERFATIAMDTKKRGKRGCPSQNLTFGGDMR